MSAKLTFPGSISLAVMFKLNETSTELYVFSWGEGDGRAGRDLACTGV